VTSTREPLHLEDLTAGRTWTTGSHELTVAEVVEFASRYDPQPFHVDAEAARGSLFGRQVASGWHTAAVTMRLLVDDGPPVAGGIIGVGGEISWPRPALPGDVLRVVSEVIEARPSRSRPDRGLVTMENRTLNQRDEVVQTFRVTVVVPRRPPA
jgi:acyl dehydratase